MQLRLHIPLGSRLGAAALAALLGLSAISLLLGCSSSEPTDPRVDPGRDDTYVFATMTLLEVPPTGDPEFFDCTTLAPLFPGETWEMYGDLATAGVVTDTGEERNLAITATDTTNQIGVAIEFRIVDLADPNAGISLRGLPAGGNPCSTPSAGVNGVFADVNALCARVSSGTWVSESRFVFNPCEPWSIELTSWETDAGGLLQQAVSSGGNDFSPTGIVEGTFSFVGTNSQVTPSDEVLANIQIDGCFRVSVPGDERGVPVNPNVASSLCTP